MADVHSSFSSPNDAKESLRPSVSRLSLSSTPSLTSPCSKPSSGKSSLLRRTSLAPAWSRGSVPPQADRVPAATRPVVIRARVRVVRMVSPRVCVLIALTLDGPGCGKVTPQAERRAGNRGPGTPRGGPRIVPEDRPW